MPNCTDESIGFPRLGRRRIEADFSGGDVSSDGGVLLLRQVDRHLQLLERLAPHLPDPRDPDRCVHDQLTMLRQRVYGLCLGYEDVNDHSTLRHDPGFQTSLERDQTLASEPTLCRFENRMDRAAAWAVHQVMIEQFIASFDEAPSELILDFDATDDAVHGKQEGRFFHGYYDHHCFLPLYVFCGDQCLVAYLRQSNRDPALHTGAILKLLVTRLRQAWPEVKITFRADSGFCRHRVLGWCELYKIHYVVGLAKNSRILDQAEPYIQAAKAQYEKDGEKVRLFAALRYGAKSWRKPRRVVCKLEHSGKGPNPRFVVTNREEDPRWLYDQVYCARGEMENRIKEQQLGLFADRTSAHRWWANQWRLLLSALAYTLLEAIRRLALKGTELARAQVGTIRLKLLKVGAVILRNTRRIRFLLSSAYPYPHLYRKVAQTFAPP